MGGNIQNLSLGWLDLGESDQRRAKEYLSQFEEGNTLDELGFGILRDAFADIFFPATNTVMTQARYLVFIPALCRMVERERHSGRAAKARLEKLGNELREALGDLPGVIGKLSKEKLKRYPPSIYWGALQRLGIFLHPNRSLSYYLDHLDGAGKVAKDDDGLSHLQGPELSNWDKKLCDLLDDGYSFLEGNGELPPTIDFALTRHEAVYLRDKYRSLASREPRPSILSHLIDNKYSHAFGFPWDVPCPPSLRSCVDHARCFSMLAQGATFQYYHLLIRKREESGIAGPSCDLSDCFGRWWEATFRDLSTWNLEEFFGIARSINGIRRPESDIPFIRGWRRLNAEATSAQAMLESSEASELIHRREKSTRPSKSRLYHSEYLQRWTPPEQAGIDSMAGNSAILPYSLKYRSEIGSSFVNDIVSGLEGATDV